MRYWINGSLALLILCALADARPALAQRAVCPQPAPDQEYYVACPTAGRLPTARLLADVAVDHLFKSSIFPFTRRPLDLLRLFDSKRVTEDKDPIVEYMARLNNVEFTRIDTATGTVAMDVAEEDRAFSWTAELGGSRWELSWRLPAHLRGGYWRTPDALQVALWDGSTVEVEAKVAEKLELRATISCIAVSADGVRVVTSSPATPDLLVSFEGCE